MSRRHSSPAPATPLDREELLEEILLRLPPQPSSLSRASLVCKQWRSVLSDARFLSRFRKHHRKPPLLGFFVGKKLRGIPIFTPVLEPPDRIPSTRFSVPESRTPDRSCIFSGCRHGLAVLVHPLQREIVVWDPLSGQQRHVAFPPGLDYKPVEQFQAAVLCADAEDGHVHGDCFLSPFKLVFICAVYTQTFGSLYNSVSGVWGNIVSVSFSVIEKPAHNHHVTNVFCFQLLRMEDGVLGLAVVSELTVQLWERKSNCDGFFKWMLLQKITPLERMLPRGMPSDDTRVVLLGYDEDTHVIVMSMGFGKFILQLESMQIRKISEINDGALYMAFYPYTNFYTAGRGVG
ncbi:unnamed protein product [Alopecurus aequalis]